ncbi:MAG: ParB/RepB/Spo0J family partition protein [Sedimentisphaerales bacterium]|nr:ParB/RepB/Spo0J family partition protein [Sedimentisphaerales bacterium]
MPETKRRLGKGLNSLLSSTRLEEIDQSSPAVPETVSLVAKAGERILSLLIEKISTNPHQPRQHWNEQKLLDLADSIKANGLIQPIIVRPLNSGFQLVAGERRLRAAQMAGLTEIAAIVRDATEEQMLEWALVENIHRADLSPIERARAYQHYLKSFSLTQETAAGKLGEDRSTIANYVRLLELPDEIQKLLEAGSITMGHARALLSLENAIKRSKLAQLIIAKKLSVRDVERQVQVLKNPLTDVLKTPETTSPLIMELQQQMTQALGTKVIIKTVGKKARRGKIIIEFYSLDDFDRIKEKLQISTQ